MENSNPLSQISDELAGLVEKAGPSVVLVNARRRFPASGFFYAPGRVITASHVVQNEDSITVETAGGDRLPARLAGRDPNRDLALLRLEKETGTAAAPAEGNPRAGQLALALARPDSGGIQASLGMITAVSGPVRTGRGLLLESILRTNIVPYPGFSGGPLLDMHGKVLGMNTSGMAMGSLITLPAVALWEAAHALDTHGRIPHAYLGIRSQVVQLAASQQKTLGREQSSALLLVGIEEGSPAEKAGLLTGDILAGLSGTSLDDAETLQITLGSEPVDGEGVLEVLRGERRIEFKVKFGERPTE